MAHSENVLALMLCEWDEMNFVHHLQQLSGRVRKKYSFSYSRWDSSPFDIDQYTEQCIDIVREKKIDLVVSGTDVSALVHAAIAETFPHIRGPSVESVFLTCHKYYSNTVLGSDLYQNRSVILQLNQDMEEIMTIASEFLYSTDGTCFIKPVLGYSELGSRKITNLEDLHEAVSALKRDRHLHYITEKFMKKWISSEAYPLAATPCALLEEFCEFQYSSATMCSVQGGNILRTAMADWLRVKDRGCVYTSKFISAVIPPSVKKEEEMKAWQMTDRIVTKMIQKGFDDQSLNVEFFVLPNGDFKFLEINGRIDHILGPLCGQVYKHGDLVKNLLKLGSGNRSKILSTEEESVFLAW
ncbi:uncharacterized protein [Ptychodera flava]|uniref:uncharacterized protein n=1 Tax=Ptychodera flava TaxID=63121 RepID=UPI00396AAB22